MIFKEGHIYHIFNQGNNKEQVFFTRENYIYFLHKITQYILPYADILAWCIMPNHFHLMVYVNSIDGVAQTIDGMIQAIKGCWVTLSTSLLSRMCNPCA